MSTTVSLTTFEPSENPPSREEQGTSLCVACGLCCNGALHDEANLSPQEIFFVESLGLAVEIYPTQAAFLLPCPRWHNGRCSVYPIRPNVCCTYRCKLLRALDAKVISFHTAMRHVTTAQKLIAEIDAILGEPATTGSVWNRVKRFAERNGYVVSSTQFSAAFSALETKTSTLHSHLKQYFHLEQK